MQSNYQNSINAALKELAATKSISSGLLVCNTLLEYMGIETKTVEDIELSKIKLPNAERYDRWFDAHPHFRGDRACFDLTPKTDLLEAKFYALKKRSKLFIAGSATLTPNFEDREYTRTDPNMKVGIDFFLTPEKDAVIVVLSNKGSLRLVELLGRLTNTQNEIFTIWHNIAQLANKNALHTTIWESFKLSSLNKKFYEGIANSFTTLTQHLQKDGVEEQLANQFTNRLHGRLLFLWFLRKKHIINEAKEYFTLGDQSDTKYYTNTLSTLFFNVLNNEDHQKIDPITPYLNGGLFDQEADSSYWKTHSPTFPTGFFKALYDHFDSFNFTTDESTPEYEQIAIDPEMLGRIFESFLATLKTETGAQAKKANGAFYTPREIVSYMSQESIRQYLYAALDASAALKGSIDELLDRSDSEWALAGTNSKRDTVAKEDRERIMDALRKIRVLDPAVGSGAFPMGVLHKILSIFERLDPNFDSYETKLSILRSNIYGVDIDPTAIEIARLRAWLSIIVDVEERKKIKPLPNLDFKFICANTLMGLTKSGASFTTDEMLKPTLIRIRDEYYATSSKVKKNRLQKEYLKLTHKDSIFDTEETRQLKSYQPFEAGSSASFYDPELMHGVSAFDLIIANPPYISALEFMATHSRKERELLNSTFDSAKGTYDLYVLFIEKAIKLLNTTGRTAFINPNKYLSAKYAQALREYILNSVRLESLVDISGIKVFNEASVYPILSFMSKGEGPYNIKLVLPKIRQTENFELSNYDTYSVSSDVLKILPENIWGFLLSNKIDLLIKTIRGARPLSEFGDINASSTAAESDEYSNYISESQSDTSLKLLNTGLIDSYSNSWGRKAITSKREKYITPFLELEKVNERRREMYSNQKVIYAKLAKNCEAFLDTRGEFAALNTNFFYNVEDETVLKFIGAYSNSKMFMFFYKQFFGALRMAGGFYQFQAPQLRVIPCKMADENSLTQIEGLVDKILSITMAKDYNNTQDQIYRIAEYQGQIDQRIYELYGLTLEEINTVENSLI